jgi:MoaA/NifB/PqqE/SkfB family radical SAM enzyme
VVESFHQASAFHLQGWGEPLLHPRLHKLIELADPAHRSVSLNTNMTVMSERLAARLLETRVTDIRVSVDGADKATYEYYRPPASWERMMRNLGLLLAARERMQATETEVSLVVVCQQRSVGQLADLVERAAGMGLREIRIQQLREFGSSVGPDAAEIAMAKAKCDQVAAANGINLDWSFFEDWASPVCRWPWRKLYVRADGKVNLCCEKVFGDSDYNDFGDVMQQSARQIWNGPRYRAARKALASGSYPRACAGCPIYHFPEEEGEPEGEPGDLND